MLKELLTNYRFIFRALLTKKKRKDFRDVIISLILVITKVGVKGLFRIITDQYGERGRKFLNSHNQYQVWLKSNEFNEEMRRKSLSEISRLRYKPKISIIMSIRELDRKYLRKSIDSLTQQVYQNWELCLINNTSSKKHIQKILKTYNRKYSRIKTFYFGETAQPATFDTVFSLVDGQFVGFLEANDELTPDALFEIIKFLNEHPNTYYIYTDEDIKDEYGGRFAPFFKPNWSPYLFFSMNYAANFGIVRKSMLHQHTSSFRFENQRYDLILRLTEITDRIGHISKPLYRKTEIRQISSTKNNFKQNMLAKETLNKALSRRGINATILDSGIKDVRRISYKLENEPLVSIIILTRDNLDYLKRCIESIRIKTDYRNYELIVIDNGSQDQRTLEYLKSLSKVFRDESEFNASRLHNLGASHASGKYILLLNDDVEIIHGSWLREMVSIAEQEDVGVVGAKLLFPDGTIQHGGVIIGLGGIAGHAFYRHDPKEPTYFNLLNVARDCSAVTGACMLVKRSVYDKVKGFDEKFCRAFGDTDFCLKIIHEAQTRVIYTPYATLIHHEGITRGKERTPPFRDIEYFEKKWRALLAKGDPYYNPNLSLERSYEIKIEPTRFTIANIAKIEEPLATLLEVYLQRRDLQIEYPEALHGDYERLINWAYTVGVRNDSAKNILKHKSNYYRTVATLLRIRNQLLELST